MKTEKVQELLNLVRDNYQAIASEFDATRKKEIGSEIRLFANKVKAGDSILDLGCGNGRLLEALKEKEIKYLGVDNSSELIKLAQNNYPDNKFVVGDILELENTPDILELANSREVLNGTYDFIFCLAVLQHIPSRELRIKALKDMSLKLKNGGEIIISNWNLWAHKKYRSQLFKRYFLGLFGKKDIEANDLIFPWKNSRGEEKSRRYYHAFTKMEIKKLARLSGLKLLVLKKDQYNIWAVLKKTN